MKCGECMDQGLTSTLREMGCRSSLVGTVAFFDEQGRRHYHDPNVMRCGYTCSNGHFFEISDLRPCPEPSCDYHKVPEDPLRKALLEVERELYNLLPHIPQACYPGHEKFIESHVEAAFEIIRKALNPETKNIPATSD